MTAPDGTLEHGRAPALLVARDRAVDIGQERLSGAHRQRRMVIVGMPHRRVVGELWLDEDDLWKLRVGLGLEVFREVVEVAEVRMVEQERGGPHDGEEWKAVAVDAPAHMVGGAPIDDQMAVIRRLAAARVDLGVAAKRHQPIRVGVGRERAEPSIADHVRTGEERRRRDQVRRKH